jgi:branched-chain amino acid transport system ATP-binding protein
MARPTMILLESPRWASRPDRRGNLRDREEPELAGTVSFLLAEQARWWRCASACGYILENGRVVMEGSPPPRRERGREGFYLGISTEGRRSFRETKLPPQAWLA